MDIRQCDRCQVSFQPMFERQRRCWECWKYYGMSNRPDNIGPGHARLITDDGPMDIKIVKGIQFLKRIPSEE